MSLKKLFLLVLVFVFLSQQFAWTQQNSELPAGRPAAQGMVLHPAPLAPISRPGADALPDLWPIGRVAAAVFWLDGHQSTCEESRGNDFRNPARIFDHPIRRFHSLPSAMTR